jgi:hypothetical protein
MNVEFNAIEVPAEANPLTEGILFHVLRSASSADPHQIQTGTKQLQEWEKARGFYPLLQVCTCTVSHLCLVADHLQAVFLDKSLPYEVRYLAIIQLKNGIDKYWRKTAQKYNHHPTVEAHGHSLTILSAASKEDKNTIRVRLLESAVNEADNRLALQNAIMVAKIVRFEYPNDWYLFYPSSPRTASNNWQARCLPATHPDPPRFHRAERLPWPIASSAASPAIHCQRAVYGSTKADTREPPNRCTRDIERAGKHIREQGARLAEVFPRGWRR